MNHTLLHQKLNAVIPGSELVETTLPQCPEIKLWLLAESYPQSDLTAEQIDVLMNKPPYWAFCWASGQVLAREILKDSAAFKGTRVVDFGAGSGVVAIAAAKAGANVFVCDQDPTALAACRANAALNSVEMTYFDCLEKTPRADVITVADVFYDRDNIPLLAKMLTDYESVWVSDSRLRGKALEGMRVVDQFDSFTVPDLSESPEFNTVTLYKNQ